MLNQKRPLEKSFTLDDFNDKELFEEMWKRLEKPIDLSVSEMKTVKERCYKSMKQFLMNEIENICKNPKTMNLHFDQLREIYS